MVLVVTTNLYIRYKVIKSHRLEYDAMQLFIRSLHTVPQER